MRFVLAVVLLLMSSTAHADGVRDVAAPVDAGMAKVSDLALPIDLHALFPDTVFPAHEAAMSVASDANTTEVAQRCCKYCCKGKPCGNSCISRRYNCHQPPGCACAGC